MRQIWHYDTNDRYKVFQIPKNADFVHAVFRDNQIQFWFMVDPNPDQYEHHYFASYGTGEDIPDDHVGLHRATFIDDNKEEVWHIFHFRSSVPDSLKEIFGEGDKS
jgi:hypothetical protein